MKVFYILLLTILVPSEFFASESHKINDGLIRIKSRNSVKLTIDKLEKSLIDKGMTIFSRINHSAGAKKVGKVLNDSELLIFGNPKIGTNLIKCNAASAIDLPMKALSWKDKSNQVWLAYNDPKFLAERYKIDTCAKVELSKISKALANFSAAAVK